MSSEHSLRQRKQPHFDHVLYGTKIADPQGIQLLEDEEEIRLSWSHWLIIWRRRITGNIWPWTQDFIQSWREFLHVTDKVLIVMTLLIALATAIVLVLYDPTTLRMEPRWRALSLWHVELHNAWLRDHDIRETTWILSEEALNHTSNERYLVGDVLLQFPQSSGGAGFTIRDVTFDPTAHYGVISMRKLEEHHVPLRTIYSLGKAGRPVVGVEFVGQDIVAVVWGGEGTYILKAWTLKNCERWVTRPLCLWWHGKGVYEIPADTMRELVDKHRTIPASVEGLATPWEQRAFDQREKKKKKWFWRS